MADLTTLVIQVKADADKATADIKRLQDELAKLKGASTGADKVTESIKKISPATVAAIEDQRRLNKEFLAMKPAEQAMKRLENAQRGLERALNDTSGKTLNQYNSNFKRATNELHAAERAVKSLGNANKEASGSFMGAVRSIGMLRGAIAAVGIGLLVRQIYDLTKSLVMMAAEFQALDVRMKGIFQGDAVAAEGAGKWLQDFIIKTPFQLKDAQKAFIQFKAFGIDPMGGALQTVADMTARLGGSEETLERITLALGKAFLKGKMQGYELRQMHMAGVPAADLLAKALGRSTDEIYAMARAGTIGRDKIKTLMDAMGELAKGQALAFVKTFIGAMSNLKDYVAIFAREVGLTSGLLDELARTIVLVSEGITGVTKDKSAETFGRAVAAAVNDLNDALEKMVADGSFKKMVDSAITFAEAMGAVVTAVKNLMPWLEKMNKYYNTMGLGSFLNPATFIRRASDLDTTMGDVTGNYGEKGFTVKNALGFQSVEIDKSTISQEKFNAALEKSFGTVKDALIYFGKTTDEVKRLYEGGLLAGSGAAKVAGALREIGKEEKALAAEKKKSEAERILAEALAAKEDEETREEAESAAKDIEKRTKKQIESIEKLRRENKITEEQYKQLRLAVDGSTTAVEDLINAFQALIDTREKFDFTMPTLPGEPQSTAQGDTLAVAIKEDYKYRMEGIENAKKAELDNIQAIEHGWNTARERMHDLLVRLRKKETNEEIKEEERRIRHAAIIWGKMFDSVVDNFMDMLINGFSSEKTKNAINSIFSDVGSIFADELKKTLGEAMAEGDWGAFSFGDADSKKEGFQLSSGWTEAGIAIGTAIMQAGIKEQSAGQAAMGGAISGAVMGAQGGGWIGAIIGGIAGGAFGYSSVDPEGAERTLEGIGLWPHDMLGYDLGRITDPLGLFEPGDNPTTTIETTLTGGRVETRDQGATVDQQQMFLREVISLQNNMRESFRAALMTFRDASLFDLVTPFQGIPLVGGPPGDNLLPGERQGSMEQILAQLGEVELPETFQRDFAAAFQTGLENLGMTARGIEQLGEEIANLPWDERLTALMTVASALRKIRDLSEINPMVEVGMDSMAQFADYMADAGDNVALLSAGWESMSIAERAGELERIGDIWADVLSNALQILGQLDQMQKQINATFDNAIESIRLNEMTTGERRAYLTGQVDAGMTTLRAADSPEEIQAAVDDVFKYIQMLADVLKAGYEAANRILSTRTSLLDAIRTVNPLAMATMTPEQTFGQNMTGWMSETDRLTNTIYDEDSDIVEVANAVGRVSEIWNQALAATVEMLRAVEQARAQVTQLFSNARLTAQMNGMTPGQLQTFNQQRMTDALGVMGNPASTASEVAAASATYVELLMAEAEARATAIQSILDTVDVFAELAEANPLEDFAKSSTEIFNEFMAESTASVSELMTGFDDLTLEEKADRLRQIGDIWGGVLEQTMQMLQAIDQAQRAMNQNYESARESLLIGGMTDQQQIDYYRTQIANADERLHDPNISLEEAQAASDDMFRYIQMLRQLFESDPNRGMYDVVNGQSYADIINDLYTQGQAESNRIFDDLREHTQEVLITFEAALGTATTALGALGAMAEDADPWGDVIELLDDGFAVATDALTEISAELVRQFGYLTTAVALAVGDVGTIADVWVNNVAAAIIAMMEAAQVEANDRIVEVRQGVLDALEAFRLAVLAARDALAEGGLDDAIRVDTPIGRADDGWTDDPLGDDGGGGDGGGGDGGGGDGGGGDGGWGPVDRFDDGYDGIGTKSSSSRWSMISAQAAEIQRSNQLLALIAERVGAVPIVNVDVSVPGLQPLIRKTVSMMTAPKLSSTQRGEIY